MVDQARPYTPAAGRTRRSELRRTLRRNLPWLLMAAPAVVWLLLFAYLPMAGLVVAFKNYRYDRGILGSEWVGLKNFQFLFATSDTLRITVNTLLLNALFIASTLLVSLAVAVLLAEIHRSRLARFYQTALFFPYFISWVIAGVFVYAFLNTTDGLLNQLIVALGGSRVRWYASPQPWPAILTVMSLWKNVGFWSIVYFAGILGINTEYYEAARMDGAGWWQQVRSITLPLIAPLILINTLLSIGRIFYADFGLFFHVTRDSQQLYPTTDVIDTYVYRALRTSGDIGMASAAGFYQALVGFVLVLLANWVVRRIDAEKALF